MSHDIKTDSERLTANINPYPAGHPFHAEHEQNVAAEREAERDAHRQRILNEGVERELSRLRALHIAKQRFDAEQAEEAKAHADESTRILDGAQFLFDIPDRIPALWGKGDDILWARGEAMMICGPQGVGKTTVFGQVLRARIGLPVTEVFGYPVEPCESRCLYLAMDRPDQARRNLARMFNKDEDEEIARECLRFWIGPPPEDIAAKPDTLVRLAERFGADTIFIDSIKDAAVGLSKDEVGAGYNRARQLALAEGIQIAESHHTVKNSVAGGPPNRLADVYGSTWLTSGAGSVIMLWGEAGDPVVDLMHLKQPMSEVGPFKVLHNRETGLAQVFHDEDTDVVALARRCSTTGLSAKEAAVCMYGKETPTRADVEKARRRMGQYVTAGLLVSRPADGGGRGNGDRWFAAAPSSWTEGEGDSDDRYH